MKYLSLITLLAVSSVQAQPIPLPETLSECRNVNDFLIDTTSLWYNRDIKLAKPLDVDGCIKSDDGYRTTCMKEYTSLDDAKDNATKWLNIIKRCTGVTYKGTAKHIVIPTPKAVVVHDVIPFDPLTFRSQKINMSLRIQSDNVINSKSMVTWVLQQDTDAFNKNNPPRDMCPMIQELLEEQHISSRWQIWQGPIEESTPSLRTHTCARVPVNAQSRYDCEFETRENDMLLSMRWPQPPVKTSSIDALSKAMAQSIASCKAGIVLTEGTVQHTLEYPKYGVVMKVRGRRNDVGRGPTLEFTAYYRDTPQAAKSGLKILK